MKDHAPMAVFTEPSGSVYLDQVYKSGQRGLSREAGELCSVIPLRGWLTFIEDNVT